MGIEGNHLKVISIIYQKLTANVLTSRNGRCCHEAKAEARAMLPLALPPRGGRGKNSDSWAPPQSSSVPLKVWSGNPHVRTHLRLIIPRVDLEQLHSPRPLSLSQYWKVLPFALFPGCLGTICACKIPVSF